jgi:enoyl-CoA hydratase/carnithine racemase
MTSLISERIGQVQVLTMNRPEKHNALNTGLTQDLIRALNDADSNEDVRAIVLTGAGKSFCAGADTTEFAALIPDDPLAVNRRADLTTTLHLSFSKMSKPVIGAVFGNALGGGAGLAIACDMVVMADDTRFGYPELRHGIVAAVVLANLVRQVGRKHAFELVSLAEPIGGQRALELGLANRSVPREMVMEVALEMANRLAQWSPLAMETTKRTFHRVSELPLAQALDVGRDANVMMRGFRKTTQGAKP